MKELKLAKKKKKKQTSHRRRRHHLCGNEIFEKARAEVLGKEEDKEKKYKSKRRAHKEAMERKYPGREIFSSVEAAVKAHLNDEEKELWKSEADSSSFFLRLKLVIRMTARSSARSRTEQVLYRITPASSGSWTSW